LNKSSRMTASEFAAKWMGSTRTERAAAQEHFIDLCRLLGFQTPNQADPTGDWYAFEKGADKVSGGDGFADVWKRGHFAWEYKRKKKNLAVAYDQLLQYREALENPPLLVVCDLNRFEVHTNFTNTVKTVHRFTLDDLASNPEEALRVLRAVMGQPELMRPTNSPQELTEVAAKEFASLATGLRNQGYEALRVAHFLNKLVFCMFAEDAGLLPQQLVKRLADNTRNDPERFSEGLRDLFGKMSHGGGLFGTENIQWFNGGLFDGDDVLPVNTAQIQIVRRVSDLDWSQIEPAIFGTLFERGLDPDKRSQLGAHYTDRDSIIRLVDPVLITPLREEWGAACADIEELLAKPGAPATRTKNAKKASARYRDFLERLRGVKVLDPACGSGNFLYVALQSLKDLEREVILWASLAFRTAQDFPAVGPQAVWGIELNPYAAELARVAIWIGEIQWMLRNGFHYRSNPILSPLDNILVADAVLDLSDPDNPREPVWPETEFVVGNPPFVGGKLLRTNLGNAYVDSLFEVYEGRVAAESDYVCYWFEKARDQIEQKRARRVGLLATQGIRGGANRTVLAKIKETGDIFLAWSDRPWIVDGAEVHVSLVGFDDGSDKNRVRDGVSVVSINADLTAGTDVTKVLRLKENRRIAFMGDTKGGRFNVSASVAKKMLASPNPHGKPNQDVVVPWLNGNNATKKSREVWIVDFGTTEVTEEEAALYEAPYEYVRTHVMGKIKPDSRGVVREKWWIHERPRPEMRKGLSGLSRFIGTVRHSKHRIFFWIPRGTLPDSALIVFARDDDYTFGVLQSRPHSVWALAKGTQVREKETGFRYTPTTTFETFPFPRPTTSQRESIAIAAAELDKLRRGWIDVTTPAGRTLTGLYNDNPTWLRQAHGRLDLAVYDAYGWTGTPTDEEIVRCLLTLSLEREPVGKQSKKKKQAAKKD